MIGSVKPKSSIGKLVTAISYYVENQGSPITRAVSGVARIFALFVLWQFLIRAEAQVVMLRLEKAT